MSDIDHTGGRQEKKERERDRERELLINLSEKDFAKCANSLISFMAQQIEKNIYPYRNLVESGKYTHVLGGEQFWKINVDQLSPGRLPISLYLIGEVHEVPLPCTEKNAVSLLSIIDNLARKAIPEKPIDVYLEQEFEKTPWHVGGEENCLDAGKHLLQSTILFLSLCLTRNKKSTGCFYNQDAMRFHYVDIRHPDLLPIMKVYRSITNTLKHGEYSDDEDYRIRLQDKVKYIVRGLDVYSVELDRKGKNQEMNLKKIYRSTRIERQLKGIKSDDIRQQVVEFFKISIEQAVDDFVSLRDAISKKIEKTALPVDRLFDILEELRNIIVGYATPFQDMYTASRILRDYDKPGREGLPTTRAIVLTGSAHTTRLAVFFQGFTSSDVDVFSGSSGCLPVSPIVF